MYDLNPNTRTPALRAAVRVFQALRAGIPEATSRTLIPLG